MQANLSHCRKLLKEKDYPRYALSLTLPLKQREMLWVLGAFNIEVSRAAEMSEPATRAIRLKWWMEALEGEQPRKHPVVEAVHALSCDRAILLQAIEAREVELEGGYLFDDMKALDAYATATGRFWLPLAESEEQRDYLTALGQVWALQGLLWSTGYWLSQGSSTLPKEVAAAHGVNLLEPEGDITSELHHIIQTLARRVEETLKRLPDSANHPLQRAVPFLLWRAQKMQKTPALALALNPPESRLTLLWKIFVG